MTAGVIPKTPITGTLLATPEARHAHANNPLYACVVHLVEQAEIRGGDANAVLREVLLAVCRERAAYLTERLDALRWTISPPFNA